MVLIGVSGGEDGLAVRIGGGVLVFVGVSDGRGVPVAGDVEAFD